MSKTLGEMTPEERKQAVDRAVDLLQRELTANADAIGRAMDPALYVLVKVPAEEIDGNPSELLDLVVGHEARVTVNGLALDGEVIQASVGKPPS